MVLKIILKTVTTTERKYFPTKIPTGLLKGKTTLRPIHPLRQSQLNHIEAL